MLLGLLGCGMGALLPGGTSAPMHWVWASHPSARNFCIHLYLG